MTRRSVERAGKRYLRAALSSTRSRRIGFVYLSSGRLYTNLIRPILRIDAIGEANSSIIRRGSLKGESDSPHPANRRQSRIVCLIATFCSATRSADPAIAPQPIAAAYRRHASCGTHVLLAIAATQEHLPNGPTPTETARSGACAPAQQALRASY